MSKIEILMPKMGESIMEATVLSWLKKVGDSIEEDESLLEVATDKVDTEVPSTHGGIIKEILAEEGDVVEVGKPIAIIMTENGDSSGSDDLKNVSDVDNVKEEAEVSHEANVDSTDEVPRTSGKRFYSPLVRNIAQKEGLTVKELDAIDGSGKDGRVTKRDILDYIGQKPKEKSSSPESVVMQSPASKAILSGEDDIVEMDRMRKMIADRMVESKRISPHVTSFVEADVTNIVNWRRANKDKFLKREDQPLTYTPVFVHAIVQAILEYPQINIQVDGNRIIHKKQINIGMAVALPSGNLIVPVIKNADQLSMVGLVKAVNDLAKRARNSELKPDELSGGTYSISNVGSFGNVMGTPIIMQPQVAIMALGAIQKKPSVIETADGDFIGIRHKMFLSHSYDHRVVDGALGGMFVRRVADFLENFDVNTQV